MEAALRELAASGVALPEGVDLTHMHTHAESLWKMLDEMAESDPERYSQFVKQQFESMKHAETGVYEITPTPGHCARMVFVRRRTQSRSGALPPPAPVKLELPADAQPGQPIYVNICSHLKMQPPSSGGEVVARTKAPKDSDPGLPMLSYESRLKPKDMAIAALLTMEVPLAPGPVRPVRGTARTAWVLDVCVHPWLSAALDVRADFVPHFMQFIANTIAEELWIDLKTQAGTEGHSIDVTVQKEPYISGVKSADGKAEQPVPFDLTPYVKGAKRDAGAAAAGASTADSAPATAASGGRAAANAASSGEGLLSPGDLLKQMREQDRASSKAPKVSLPGRGAAPAPSRRQAPLIQEVTPVAALSFGPEDAPVLDPSPPFATAEATIGNGVASVTFYLQTPPLSMDFLQLAMLDLDIAPTMVRLALNDLARSSWSPTVGGDPDFTWTRREPVEFALPQAINVDEARAKFSRVNGTLTVTAPVL